ncbi:hypothetical protein EB796_024631 [Bugula neritina]|uniref:Uncharacterized protein n=1 Tax=Bugula neritina TaxID=10212 RepID=A0A7J7IUJ8_BUGNE|nr:hypothetical protein EB796_024631 [Bugula neritina]
MNRLEPSSMHFVLYSIANRENTKWRKTRTDSIRENLNLATTVSDYKVSVGKQVEADCYTLTATELRCQLDTTLPPPFDDAPVFQNQPLPLVNVTVGNLAFPLGYIYYHHIVPPSPPPTLTAAEIGGIVAAVIVALVSVTLIVLLLYKRRLNKVQRAQQRMAMTGFTRVDSTNSLQTQVQSILIEQDLSVALFSLLIPESFVTQERIIGQGHFGQVYRGRIFVPGRNINKPVAIKSLKCKFTTLANGIVYYIATK